MSIPGPTGVLGLDPDKCLQRNKVASLRNLAEAAPVRLGGGSGLRFFASGTPEGTLIDSIGEIPKEDDEILALIHKMQPQGAEPLKREQVFWHVCEAANSNYVSDRHIFLGSSTLMNIAKGGIQGVAFMNSHRTGGFSTESELPFGRTCGARYEQYMTPDGQIFDRTLLLFYMLQGSKPVGLSGPDTDEINRMILGGVLKDVSVGIGPGVMGTRLCDVCGNEYYSRDCPHYAGSSYDMTEEQRQAQVRRGVLRGVATYTLNHWEIGEVSGVYDGAVPGAGFAKFHEALRAGTLPEDVLSELSQVYAAYL
jgi:hypothetical protein